MLRAARFAAQLDFAVGRRCVVTAIEQMADRLGDRVGRADPGRVHQAAAVRPTHGPGLRILVDTGLADQFIPELPALRLEIDEHHRHKDVYEHTLTVVEQAIDLEPEGPDLVAAAGRAAARHRQAGNAPVRSAAAGSRSTTTRWSVRA